MVITGPMFCGKTEELLKILRVEEYSDKKTVLFKHSIDDRYFPNDHQTGKSKVLTHDGIGRDAIVVRNSEGMHNYIKENEKKIDVIGIDEGHFYDDQIIPFCDYWGWKKGKLVIVSALNTDFRREPFRFKKIEDFSIPSDKHVGDLMAISDCKSLQARCTFKEISGSGNCGELAYFSQRLINGEPAPYDDSLILVAGKDSYEARCPDHHFVPGRPE